MADAPAAPEPAPANAPAAGPAAAPAAAAPANAAAAAAEDPGASRIPPLHVDSDDDDDDDVDPDDDVNPADPADPEDHFVRSINEAGREQLHAQLMGTVQDLRTCQVCSLPFGPESHATVRLLRCEHAVHSACYADVQRTRDFACVLCQAVTPRTVTAELAGPHPLAELHVEMANPQLCMLCQQSRHPKPLLAACICREKDCNIRVCGSHRGLHVHSDPDNPDEVYHPEFENLQPGAWKPVCLHHVGDTREVVALCVDCDQPICHSCAGHHAHHKIPFNMAYVNEGRGRLNESISAAKAVATEYLDRNLDIGVLREAAVGKYRDAREELVQSFDVIHRRLRAREAALLAELERRHRVQLENLNKSSAYNEMCWRGVHYTAALATELSRDSLHMKVAAAPVLGLMEGKVRTRIAELEVAVAHPRNPARALPALVHPRLNIAPTLLQTIDTIGEWAGDEPAPLPPLLGRTPIEEIVDRGMHHESVVGYGAIAIAGNEIIRAAPVRNECERTRGRGRRADKGRARGARADAREGEARGVYCSGRAVGRDKQKTPAPWPVRA